MLMQYPGLESRPTRRNLPIPGAALGRLPPKNRPKSKELSAFPKTYPLRNRAIGGEMTRM
jgi:hypothetical protein